MKASEYALEMRMKWPELSLSYLSIWREVCCVLGGRLEPYIQDVTGGTDQTSGGCSLC